MRETIQTGKTIEEAIEKAVEYFGLTREEVSIEVLETPQRKLFGSVPAKVRAIVNTEEETETKVVVQPTACEKAVSEKPLFIKEQLQHATPNKAAAGPTKEQAPEGSATGEKTVAALAFVQSITTAMGLEGLHIETAKRGEAILLRITGEGVGPLIGRRGETMEALSYLTGLVANRTGGEYEKIEIDVAGYRSKREADLASLARRIGIKVQKTGRSHTFEPMNPYERRIIHSAIGEIEGVRSESFGEGADRRIVVSCTDPARARSGEKENERRTQKPDRGGNRQHAGMKPEGRKPAFDQNREAVPIGEKKDAAARPGKGPDEELLEQLSAEGSLYGKINL